MDIPDIEDIVKIAGLVIGVPVLAFAAYHVMIAFSSIA